jgi:uncharacterized protein
MRGVFALAVAATSVLVTSCGGGASGERKTVALCIATGSPSAVSYQFGKALAEVLTTSDLGIRATVRPRTAAVENINLVTSEACELAIAPADAATDAVVGDGPTDPPQPLQAIARLYDNTVQLVVPKSSDIRELSDLRGRTVATGARGSCTEYVALRMLRLGGIQPAEVSTASLDIDDSLGALRDGRIDAFFWSGEVPSARIEQFSEQFTRVRLIDLSDLLPKLNDRFGLSYLAATVPAKTYAIDADVQTVAVPNYLVVSAALDQKIAYGITRKLFEQREELAAVSAEAQNINLQIAIATQPVNLHRGAIQYYRDVKP